MRGITKRFLTVDQLGRIIGANSERLTDDGRGRLNLTARQEATWCSNCFQPLTNVEQRRGRCDHCHRKKCCSACGVRCQVCSRLLCGDCRRGFVGRIWMTVCPICLVRLRRRQALQDQLLMRKLALERQVIHQRELARLQTLKLQAARIRATAQLQVARLKASRQMAMIREMNRMRTALARAHRHGPRY